MPRLILIPLVLILLLVLAAAVLIPLLLDEEALLELATTTLYDQTGATLAVAGDTELTLLPMPGVALADVAVTLPDEEQPAARARSVQIGVQLLPLLRGKVEVDTIRLDGLVVSIFSMADQAGKDATPVDVPGNAGGALAVPLALNVKRVVITDSRIEAVSPVATSTLLELLRLEISDLNLEQKPIPVALALRRPGEPPVELNLEGHLRINLQPQQINLDEVTAVIRGATAQPVTVTTSGTIDLASEVADLQLALELGETRGKGILRYADAESPRMDARLQLNLFDPVLLALAGPEAAAATAAGGDSSTAASSDEPLPLAALRLVDTLAVLDIEKARFDAHTINSLHVKLRAQRGVVTVSELTGELHGGRLKATATLDGEHDTATLTSSGSLSQLDIATALAATQSDPVLSGSAALDWQLDSRGATANELATSLHGPITLTTEEVVLRGTSVEKLLCEVVAVTNKEALTAPFPANTRFATLSADIRVADGKAVLDPLRADLTQIALVGNGNYDLFKQDFNATFKARLSPTLEQLDHACRVNKRLTVIDWPVNCAGSVGSDPAKWCRVDAAKILQDLAISEGKDTLQKKASKLLNKLFNKGD